MLIPDCEPFETTYKIFERNPTKPCQNFEYLTTLSSFEPGLKKTATSEPTDYVTLRTHERDPLNLHEKFYGC